MLNESMPSTTAQLDATFAALADPTRRAIVDRLARGRTHVGDLARPFAMSAPAISRHLRVLERAGLVEREIDARWRICSLRAEGLQAAHDWLEQYRAFWQASLDRLAELLEERMSKTKQSTPRNRSRAASRTRRRPPRRKSR
jgi:DNA-binding transcriptional ArsR family regulator